MTVQPGAALLAAGPSPTELLIGRVYVWLATNGLEIVIWILGAVLLARVIRWFAGRYATRVESRFSTSDLIVQTEDAKHRRALVDVVAWTLIVGIAIVVVIHILGVFGIPLSGLTGPTAVIGAASVSARSASCRTSWRASSSLPRSSTATATW